MKTLFLLFALCPFVAFATPTNSDGGSRAPGTISYYHGSSTMWPVSGEHSDALVSVIVRQIDHNNKYVIYRKLTNETDHTFILLLKNIPNVHRDCASLPNTVNTGCVRIGPTVVKIYVPGVNQSLTNIDEHNVTSLQMQAAGWGHVHSYFTHHRYWKHSYFLNYDYPGLGRVDSNTTVKVYNDGKRLMYGKYAVSNADGLQYVSTDKTKLVFTAP